MFRTNWCFVAAFSPLLLCSSGCTKPPATDAVAPPVEQAVFSSEAAAEPSNEYPLPAIGEKVADFSFVDLRYLPRKLDEFGDKKAYVIAFTNLDCPIAKRFMPRLKALDEQYREQGVQFLSLNVGPSESIVEVATQALQADIAFPFCKDFSGEAARALGATRTPEVVVLDAEQRLAYRGRIDGSVRFAGVSPKQSRADLQEAIEDVLAGREVRVKETTVDGCLITFPQENKTPDREVTFSEHIAPLLQEHCQSCHRPGTEAPFSLLTYDDAAAHAEMVGEVVLQQRMPPWFAHDEVGEIINHRSLDDEQRQLFADWVAAGTPEGDPAKLPAPLELPDVDWQIGKPDLLITMAGEQQIPAEGYIPYRYATLPYVFFRDTWVQQIEIHPGNRDVVHHCNMAYVTLENGKPTEHFITGFVPGGTAMILDEGTAFKIPAGAVLILQLHYVTAGMETTDQTSVGFIYPKGIVNKQIRHMQVKNQSFAIPPGAPHHKVVAERTLEKDSTGLGMFSHMHLRGKDMTFLAHYPDGKQETLLIVPNYSFDWQLAYRWEKDQKKFPQGTRIECIAHYDNTDFNPYNPDSTVTVHDGPQTYHEMMYGFFFYLEDEENLNLTVDPNTGYVLENEPPENSQAASSVEQELLAQLAVAKQ
ncbi:MAG: redoxin family protein [Planctomycetales bacterium]|nr:redoxin family protein [Planctomycetales bacterium]